MQHAHAYIHARTRAYIKCTHTFEHPTQVLVDLLPLFFTQIVVVASIRVLLSSKLSQAARVYCTPMVSNRDGGFRQLDKNNRTKTPKAWSSKADKANYLFNVVNDPYQETNLYVAFVMTLWCGARCQPGCCRGRAPVEWHSPAPCLSITHTHHHHQHYPTPRWSSRPACDCAAARPPCQVPL